MMVGRPCAGTRSVTKDCGDGHATVPNTSGANSGPAEAVTALVLASNLNPPTATAQGAPHPTCLAPSPLLNRRLDDSSVCVDARHQPDALISRHGPPVDGQRRFPLLGRNQLVCCHRRPSDSYSRHCCGCIARYRIRHICCG